MIPGLTKETATTCTSLFGERLFRKDTGTTRFVVLFVRPCVIVLLQTIIDNDGYYLGCLQVLRRTHDIPYIQLHSLILVLDILSPLIITIIL